MKRKQELTVPIGIVSLLLIFLVLCLATFSILSLSSASADDKLSKKMAERTTQYYAAVNQANQILADLDEKLADIRNTSSNKENYVKMTKEMTTNWQIPVNPSQALSVEVSIIYPENTGEHFYEIEKWQIINIDDWTPDQSQPVYQGE